METENITWEIFQTLGHSKKSSPQQNKLFTGEKNTYSFSVKIGSIGHAFMGNDTLDLESIVYDINSAFYALQFSLVVGKNWTDWQEDDALRGKKLRRLR